MLTELEIGSENTDLKMNLDEIKKIMSPQQIGITINVMVRNVGITIQVKNVQEDIYVEESIASYRIIVWGEEHRKMVRNLSIQNTYINLQIYYTKYRNFVEGPVHNF